MRATHGGADDPAHSVGEERRTVMSVPGEDVRFAGRVPIAAEIVRGLEAPLDVIMVRKIVAPWQPDARRLRWHPPQWRRSAS